MIVGRSDVLYVVMHVDIRGLPGWVVRSLGSRRI